jgi:hypothetical protein
MNTIRSIVSMKPSRIPSRLRLLTTRLGSMVLLFQRMPIVQFLFPEANIIGGASVANSVSLAVTTVVGLGVFDSVSGQTTLDEAQPVVKAGVDGGSTTAANGINVPATVSAPLNFEFTCTNAPSRPKSYSTTPLPNGLSLSWINTATGVYNDFITGTPATAGKYPVTITVWRSANNTSNSVSQLFNICVLGFSTQPAASTTISSGATTTLSCVATGVPVATTAHPGNGTLSYEWYQGTSGTLGAILGTSASFTTPTLTSSTNYWVRIKSVLGTSTVYANSNTAAVNVSAPASVVTVAVAPASVTEDGAGNLVYTFSRTGATTAALTANFSVAGSATFAPDYAQTGAASFSATTGTVTIPIGASTATVTIDPTGDTTVEPDETVTLTVTSGSGYTVGAPAAATGTITNDDTPYGSWAGGLPAGQNGPGHTPQNDGVTNLEKFAFNLNPVAPDVRKLTVGAGGLAGLPGGAQVGGKLRIEFLRRISSTNPGITYSAQFGSDLAGWSAVASPAGTPIDGTWERVVVDDPAGGTSRFGRVKVEQTP